MWVSLLRGRLSRGRQRAAWLPEGLTSVPEQGWAGLDTHAEAALAGPPPLPAAADIGGGLEPSLFSSGWSAATRASRFGTSPCLSGAAGVASSAGICANPRPQYSQHQVNLSLLALRPQPFSWQQARCGIGWQHTIAIHSSLEGNNSIAAAAAADADASALIGRRGGRPTSAVPAFDAQELLSDMQLDTTLADRLSASMGKLPGIQQQGILQHGPQVAAHSRRLGIGRRELSSLFCRCPKLFSRPAEERAGVLYSQLMRLGLSAAQAARCFEQQPGAATCPSFEPAIAMLAPWLAVGSKSRGRTGEQLLGDLLKKQPAAVLLLRFRAEALQHNLDNLLQLGLSEQQVVAALWPNFALLAQTPERLARLEAVVQQELGADRQLWVKVLGGVPRAASCTEVTLRQRAQALVAELGKEEARRMVDVAPQLLAINTVVWRRALAVWQLCGVADPLALAISVPSLLGYDWLNPSRLANLLALQRLLPWKPSAAIVIERYGCYMSYSPKTLAGRLLYLEQLGLLQLLVVDKRAAQREWQQQQQGLAAGMDAGDEPVFISLCDVAKLKPARFDSLAHNALLQQQQDVDGLVSSSSSSSSFEAFREGRLLQLPAWDQLLAQAEADVVELERKLSPALRRVPAQAEGGDGVGGTG